ncbi:hypothetical protein NECID01_1860 [Nematocida sp. AWRm77]|nr:hypothetical protein NECID01_1860 [Nematocida sp. AWRm77]
MIITLEEHSLFEKALASRSLVKGRSAVQGKIHVYSQEDKYAITYTEEPCGKQYVYVYMPKTKQVFQVQAALPWADSLLKEEESPPKEYRVREAPMYNSKIRARYVFIEAGDTRVFTGVVGIDHAMDVFEELDVELRVPKGEESVLDLLMSIFIEKLSHK